jgi:hypothetical protein
MPQLLWRRQTGWAFNNLDLTVHILLFFGLTVHIFFAF